jgi:propanediol utilization protein
MNSTASTAAPTLLAPVAVTATHAHLTAETVETLFCDHYRLHVLHPLGQPAQFEADETVTLIGPGGHLHHVPIIGPPRATDQVEISPSDARILGIAVPVRASGHTDQTPGVMIQGPRSRVRLDSGLICALHHVHMTPADAAHLGVREGDRLDAVIHTQATTSSLRDVQVRVAPHFRLELHLDPDEAHRLGLKAGDQVELTRQPGAYRQAT